MQTKHKNPKKAIRRSFYFSPKNLDLLEFLESHSELSPNEFLIELIRNAKDKSHKQIADDLTNIELYQKLESLINNSKVILTDDVSDNFDNSSSDQIPIISKQSLRDMDDAL